MKGMLAAIAMVGALVLAGGSAIMAQEPPVAGEGQLRMEHARFGHTATLLADGTVLVTGGTEGSAARATTLDSAEIYDPATRTFRVVGPMGAARLAHRATLLPDGRVLISGGMDAAGTVLDTLELYEPATESFRPFGEMTTPRRSHTATLLPDGTVLFVGGRGHPPEEHRSAELFDPATGASASVSPMDETRVRHDAVVLDDGRVAIIGGRVGGAGVKGFEIYDPAQRSFEAAADLAVPVDRPVAVRLEDGRVLVVSPRSALVTSDADASERVNGRPPELGRPPETMVATATLLEDGRVLAVGSSHDRRSPVYLFDPETDRFEPLERMRQPRIDHRAVRLLDGTVLVIGGFACHQASATAEIWDPVMKASVAGGEPGCERPPREPALPSRPHPTLPPLGQEREGGRIKMPGSAFAITIPADWSVELAQPDIDMATAEAGRAWEALRATAPNKAMACSIAVGVAPVPLRGEQTGQDRIVAPRWDENEPSLLWVPEPPVPNTMSSHQISWLRRNRADDPDWFGAQYSLLCLANDRKLPAPDDVFVELFRSFKLLPLDP